MVETDLFVWQGRRSGEADHDRDQDGDGRQREPEHLHLDLELGPLAPIQTGNAQNADQAARGRNDQVGQAVTKLERQNGNLTGNAQNIRPR